MFRKNIQSLVFLFLISFFLNTCLLNQGFCDNKKVLMIIAAKDFRDEEFFEPSKILKDAGFQVLVASSKLEEAVGILGGKVKPQLTIEQIDPQDYEALILVGGPGASEYWDNTVLHQKLVTASSLGKVVGAICVAPVTLAKAGILKEKKATVWSSEKETIEKLGAKYIDQAVVVDGLIVTANGPKAASAFGENIVQLLKKK